MPHLAAIQKKYKDQVTVLALSDEDLQTVTTFMAKESIIPGKSWTEAMAYIVATDPDESVKTEVFKASGGRGIPSSFIIGKGGKIEWIGHPMSIDEPLAAVVDGSWDRVAARKKHDADQAIKVEMNRIRTALSAAVLADDQTAAMEILDEGILRFPDNHSLKMQKFNLLLTRFHQYEAAYLLGHQLVDSNFEDSRVLNSLAWTIADTEGLEVRDLNLAMKAAGQANQLTGSKDAAVLDTLARVYYETGDLNGALKWQKRASKYAGAGSQGDSIRKVLQQYQDEFDKK
ncbi:MAG: hypothetical protein OSB09_08750 [Planctomycetota bacterium]|nr:hypothetical protein [Planctomycetota bacterium]